MILVRRLLLHGSSLQLSVSAASPSQSSPSGGGGLLQNLCFSRVPPPQETLHAPQVVHSDHPPPTVDGAVQIEKWNLSATPIKHLWWMIRYYLKLFSSEVCIRSLSFLIYCEMEHVTNCLKTYFYIQKKLCSFFNLTELFGFYWSILWCYEQI